MTFQVRTLLHTLLLSFHLDQLEIWVQNWQMECNMLHFESQSVVLFHLSCEGIDINV